MDIFPTIIDIIGVKNNSTIELNIGFVEELEFITNKFNPPTATMCTIDPHNIRFHDSFISLVDLV
jgi:hypothetical protein